MEKKDDEKEDLIARKSLLGRRMEKGLMLNENCNDSAGRERQSEEWQMRGMLDSANRDATSSYDDGNLIEHIALPGSE